MALEQIGNALPAVVHFTKTRLGVTGLTVTVDVWRWNGSAWTQVVTAGACTEIGRGAYYYNLASGSVTVEGLYLFIFITAGDVDQKEIIAGWEVQKAGVEYLDAAVSSRATVATIFAETLPGAYAANSAGARIGLIGDGTVTLTQVLSADAALITVVRGDDYLAVDNRHVTFSSASWVNLTGAAEIRMTVRRRAEAFGSGADGVLFTVTDTVASRVVGVGTQTLVFEFSDTNTAALLPGTETGKWDVQATLASGDIITLTTGTMTVVEDQTRP